MGDLRDWRGLLCLITTPGTLVEDDLRAREDLVDRVGQILDVRGLALLLEKVRGHILVEAGLVEEGVKAVAPVFGGVVAKVLAAEAL